MDILTTTSITEMPTWYYIACIAVYVISVIAYWKIFTKAGEAGWKAIIPILNTYVMFKIAYGNGWRFLLLLIPFQRPNLWPRTLIFLHPFLQLFCASGLSLMKRIRGAEKAAAENGGVSVRPSRQSRTASSRAFMRASAPRPEGA